MRFLSKVEDAGSLFRQTKQLKIIGCSHSVWDQPETNWK
jgi:hypothetical protein